VLEDKTGASSRDARNQACPSTVHANHCNHFPQICHLLARPSLAVLHIESAGGSQWLFSVTTGSLDFEYTAKYTFVPFLLLNNCGRSHCCID